MCINAETLTVVFSSISELLDFISYISKFKSNSWVKMLSDEHMVSS